MSISDVNWFAGEMKNTRKSFFITDLGQLLPGILMVLLLQSCGHKEPPTNLKNDPEFLDVALDGVTQRRMTTGTETAISYLDSFEASITDKDVNSIYYFYWLYYDTYNRAGKLDSAMLYVDKMLALIENSPYRNQLYSRHIKANYYKADLLLDQKKFKEAYLYYFNALFLAEKYNDKCEAAYYYTKLGSTLYSSEQYNVALPYFLKGLDNIQYCSVDFDIFFSQQQTLDNIGLTYNKTDKNDSALIYYDQALAFINTGYSQFPENKAWLLDNAKGIVYGNMGTAYAAMDKYDLAEEFYRKSIDITGLKGYDNVDAQYTRIKLAELYLKKNEPNQAGLLLKEVAALKDSVVSATVNLRWHKAMWQYAAQQNNIPEAYIHLQAYNRLHDSLTNFDERYSMADIESQVRNLQKQSEINILEEDQNLKETYLVVAVLVSVLSVIIAFLVIQNLRRSRKHVNMLKSMNSRVNEQRVQMEKALDEVEQAGKEKDRILKAVSHDMRSPINSALALIDILTTQSDNLSEEQKEYTELIKKSNEHALGLTKDLLEVATLNSEKLEKSPVDITSAISERVQLLKFKATEKGQTCNFEAPKDHISAIVNSEKILRVLSNLVTNAIKFSSIGGHINISLACTSSTFVLKVQDDGIGIPDKMKDQVYDLFSEAKRFGTSGEQPFGLGLSISKQIVEAHDGKIWLESEEGKGTTFYVEIPLT